MSLLGGLLAIGAAMAREVAIGEVAALGEPDAHQPLLDCDCVALRWFEAGEPLDFRIARDRIVGVRRDVLESGQHEVALLLRDAPAFVVERAPCPVARLMAFDYAAVLRVPTSGTGQDAECVDVEARAAEFRTGRMVALGQPDFGPMAVVNASARHDADTVVGDLDGARALLGRCLAMGDTGAPVAVTGRVTRAGSLVRPRVTSTGGAAVAVAERCVLGNLSRATYDTVRGRVTVVVGLAPVP